ncbi:MAG: 23S rRNA (adenine(2503)-C(2))-methyltransferase RlmN [Phycisphaeraceae bacterium]|nr:23S rRNA (adenine(2503)-C(2))-methyltransferase RlmN [Phycisphaeraceae bacterium]
MSHPSPHPVPDLEFALLGLTADQYADRCEAQQARGGRVGAYERYTTLMRDGITSHPLASATPPEVVRSSTSQCGEGVTIKFTQRVAGAAGTPPPGLGVFPARASTLETESVLIPMVGRKGNLTYTLCVSSQVGCAMGCTFCQTAQMGLVRSLTPAEIVAQWFAATHHFKTDVRNMVFMGMGEPLDNYENVLHAIRVLTDHRGPAVPMNKISVSSVGRIDGIRRLAEQIREPGWHRLNLAISLNAPTDEIRSRIMPINRAMPLADLRAALLHWPIYGGFKFCFEYVLIPGVNDRPEHARMLAAFVQGEAYNGPDTDPVGGMPIPRYPGAELAGMVNVIPYNPRENSPWPAPKETDVDEFIGWLLEQRLYAKRRRTKGRDTMAACGQLGNLDYRRRRAGATV